MTTMDGKTLCPYCGNTNEQFSTLDKVPAYPKKTDVTICATCRMPAMFTGKDLEVRKLHFLEYWHLSHDPEWQMLTRALGAVPG